MCSYVHHIIANLFGFGLHISVSLCAFLSNDIISQHTFIPSDFPPLAVASFSDGRCDTDGVRSNDPLFFTCELNNVVVLRVVLPNGFVSVFVHDESDLVLPAGFTVMSVEVVGGDPAPRSISLTIAIANASLLAGGEITCDDGVGEIAASAGCPLLLGMFLYSINNRK